jgi:hypothetical protein
MFTELFSPEVIEVTDSSELLRVWDDQRFEIGVKAFALQYSHEPPANDHAAWIKRRMEEISPTLYPFWFTDTDVSVPDNLRLTASVEEWRDVYWLFVQHWHTRMKLRFISQATAKWCGQLWRVELEARQCAKAVHDT